MLAAFRLEDFKFSSFHLYQKCPFKTFYGLYNMLKVSNMSKLQLQTRPTFTAIALPFGTWTGSNCLFSARQFPSSGQQAHIHYHRALGAVQDLPGVKFDPLATSGIYQGPEKGEVVGPHRRAVRRWYVSGRGRAVVNVEKAWRTPRSPPPTRAPRLPYEGFG